jgi:hypothetical protein
MKPYQFEIKSNQAPQWRCLSNIEMSHKDAVLQAIAESGIALEWRDAPDERATSNMRETYGSVWCPPDVIECGPFWAVYDRLTKNAN